MFLNGTKTTWLLLAVSALGGLVLFFVPMHWGARVLGQDSSFYVGAARELAHGRGLVVPDRAGGFVPLIHYPPLLPFLLSLGRWSKVDPWTVDRWLNSVLFSANILLTGLTVKRFSPSAWLPVTAALLAITSVGMLKLHSIADSEPIFVCCCLLGINGFCAYLQMNQRTPLVLASIAVALGCLDRYAGLSMIPVGLILTFSHRAKPMRGRLDDAIIFTMISAAPISAWITRNAVLYHNATNRTMQWHPPDAQAFAGAFATFVDWFVPSSYSQFTKTAVGGSALLVLLIVMSTWLTRNYHRSDRPGGPSANGGALRSVLIVTLCCYCGFVLIARTLFDGGINFDERILLPVFILGAMLFLIVADDVMKNRGRIAIVTRSLVFAYILVSAGRCTVWLRTAYAQGFGDYNVPPWRGSATIEWVAAEGMQIPLFSNDSQGIYFWTGRSIDEIPATGNALGSRFRDLDELAPVFAKSDGVLVYFYHPMTPANQFPSQTEIVRKLHLVAVHQFPDGVIYRSANADLTQP